MVSIVPPAVARPSERRFFLYMSIVITATVVAGFGQRWLQGPVDLGRFPLQVHLHALAFAAWISLYLLQNLLVVRGAVGLHRQLGVAGAALAAVMVPLGITVTVMAVRRGASPPFFPPNIFLVMNTLGMLVFGALVAAGLGMRTRPDWHRRLMCCATVVVMVPALGRVLPMASFGALAPLVMTACVLAYLVVGMVFDKASYGRVHRAWWVGAAAIVVMQLAIGPLAFLPPIRAWTVAHAGIAAPVGVPRS